jgi:hypothetical protein
MSRFRGPSVVVRAAQVVAALRADQLAVVPRQPMAAGGADLAMVFHRGLSGACRTAM